METRIVSAGVMSSSAPVPGRPSSRQVNQLVEAAMSMAILSALAEGVEIDDSDELIRRKMLAREAVLRRFRN